MFRVSVHSNMTTVQTAKYWLHQTKFIILLILEIPAWILSLIIIIFFIQNRTIRQTLYHHALLMLISINFLQLSITVPLAIRFYSMSQVNPATHGYCLTWIFLEFTCYTLSELYIATIAIQRHMLIFNGSILRIRWKRIIYHHFPLVLCLLYSIVLYTFLILIYPCDETQWDYTKNLCGFSPCYLVNKVLGTFDWLAHNATPTLVNAIANIILIVRVVRQKRRQQRLFRWRQQRRMTIQLFCISMLYIIAWTPCLIAGLGQLLFSPTFLAEVQTDYFLDLIYSISLFLPWISLALLPELSVWIRNGFCCGRQPNAIEPTTNTR